MLQSCSAYKILVTDISGILKPVSSSSCVIIEAKASNFFRCSESTEVTVALLVVLFAADETDEPGSGSLLLPS